MHHPGGLDIVAKIANKVPAYGSRKGKMSLRHVRGAFLPRSFMTRRPSCSIVLGTYVNGLVLDYFIFDQNVKRRVCISSRRKRKNSASSLLTISTAGATIYEAIGAIILRNTNEIITIVDKREVPGADELYQFQRSGGVYHGV